MTLRLILTRHAKSDWDDPVPGDHERCLNKRGRAAAAAVGKWLADKGYLPDQVLVSSAARTQETWARIARALPQAPRPDVLAQLYLAEPDEMLATLRGAEGACVMLIGHNPGCARLAETLARMPPSDPQFRHYPTGATTVLEFPAGRWAGVNPDRGEVLDFVVPRDLR